MTLGSLVAQLSVGLVTLGGWFGSVNPILTGLGTLLGMAYYITLLVDRYRGGSNDRD